MNDTDSTADSTPPPTFDILPLGESVRRALDEIGYTHPTPVQRAVFEPATKGKDLVVQARTGTGKTAAFGLPLVDVLVKPELKQPQALVLCPTRELALQITREVESLAKHKNLGLVSIYGGAPMARQVQQLRDGAQVVIGTPGRVLDHLSRGTLDPARIRAFVLDESDEMLSMGFLPQITEIWSFLTKGHQTLLFSATLPPDVQRIAETRLKDPEFITLSGDHIGALEIQHFVYVSHGDKVANLLKVVEIENPESAIVFCNTRDETKKVAAVLKQEGFSADWLNADLAQNDREKVMARTRDGKLRFLVATDVAARGIDISHLTHVINHDFPESAEAYVHRTGRTGRAGRTGVAISLIAPDDIGRLYMLRLTYKIFPIERSLPTAREVKSREEADVVNLFVQAFATKKPHPDDLALARRLLTHDSAEVVVAGLLRDHLGARPEAVEEAKAMRRTEAPRPVPAAKAASNGASKPRRDLAEASRSAVAPKDSMARDGGRRGGSPRDTTTSGPVESTPRERSDSSSRDRVESSPRERSESNPRERSDSSSRDRVESSPRERSETSSRDRVESSPRERSESNPRERS
ncbi:MAG TPA: DEAD/DEAH box helicase, partial [Polyangiaceae bacterium]